MLQDIACAVGAWYHDRPLCNAGLEFVTEIFDGRLQRFDCARRVCAEGSTGTQEAAELLESLDVAWPALTALERIQ